jgi:hypothetical protein
MPDQKDFDRVEGEFIHGGELFRLVKQRYAEDTLTIVCVKDIEHKRIDRALFAYADTLTDHSADHRSVKVIGNFLKDFLPIAFSLRTFCSGWIIDVTQNTGCTTFISTFSASILLPPESI